MAGFSFRKSLDGANVAPATLRVIGKNSVEFAKGDAVRINTSGFVDVCDAGEGIAGFVVGVENRDGTPVAYDSGDIDIWTMASDNQTVAKKMIVFIPALPQYLFFNDADGNMDEAHVGLYFDLASHSQVDEDTHSDTTQATVRLWQYDPDGDADASKGLFQVVESQFGQDSWDREA